MSLASLPLEAERRDFLGATDVAAILGLSPYRAPIDVWRRKMGLDDGEPGTERMRLGQILEQAIADAYSEQTGRQLRRVREVRHPRHPFLVGHPDRLIVGERGVFEAKASASTRGYTVPSGAGLGDERLDVPPSVRVQAIWYTGLTDRDWTDVVLLAHMGLHTIRVPHDAELYDDLVSAAVDWWQRHIVGREEPPPDGSDGYRRHLAERFPRDSGEELVATPEQTLLADELRSAVADAKAAEERKAGIENRLRAAMGEATRLIGPGFAFTWRAQKGRTAWKELAAELGATEEQIAAHTPPGPRVFRASFTEGED